MNKIIGMIRSSVDGLTYKIRSHVVHLRFYLESANSNFNKKKYIHVLYKMSQKLGSKMIFFHLFTCNYLAGKPT